MRRKSKALSTSNEPAKLLPMLATLIEKPFQNDDWIYEIKWDGFRILAHVLGGDVSLYSRSLKNYTDKYLPIVQELSSLNHNAVIDGEIIVYDNEGHPNFQMVQNYKPGDRIEYVVFDLLWLDGKSLLDLPLVKRKQLLQSINPASPLIQFSQGYDDGPALFTKMEELGMEGIIAKRNDSTYSPGVRSKDWLKIPTRKQQEFVVGGWAESDSRRPFRTLIFGYYKNGKLMYQGHAGNGFKQKDMPAILKRLKKLEIKKSPFANTDVLLNYTETPVHWVKPELVIQVKYATTTASGMIRKPATFLGFREDKDPKTVVLEQPAKAIVEKNIAEKPAKRSARNKLQTSEASNWPEIESLPVTSQDVFDIDGNQITITNVEKELWKGVTKADLISYYHSVSSYLLPHLQNRPLSLHIKHIKPTVSGMYIKDMEGRQPKWADVFTTRRKHKKAGMRDKIDYLVCNEKATLLWLVNLGCIDINPWTSKVSAPEEPDYIVIDLDPSDEDFSKAVTTAMAARDFFKKNKLTAFPKTSGKTGIHIYIPCAGFTFPQARAIAEHISTEIHELIPEITTTEVSINSRGDRLYLDPNQNDFADTVASPYSVRPYKLPTISTPLDWKEVKPGLDSHAFTIDNIQKRMEKKGDLFVGVLDEKIAFSNSHNLKKLIKRINRKMSSSHI
jgi:bifunctional non-homologous end joining protein LigD